jgi:mannose-6-phosphate isomerase
MDFRGLTILVLAIIECMSCSANVVRAGFSRKPKDIPLFLSMLNYRHTPLDEQRVEPTAFPFVDCANSPPSELSSSILYTPPVDDFKVIKTDLQGRGRQAAVKAIDGPSVMICTQGRGTISADSKHEAIQSGYVFYVSPLIPILLKSDSDEVFTTFRAFCRSGDL